MRVSRFALDEIGDLTAEPGTRPWAIAVRAEIWDGIKDSEYNAERLDRWLGALRSHEGYLQLEGPDGESFKTYEAFCVAAAPFGLGYDPQALDRIVHERRIATTKERVRLASIDLDTGEILEPHRPTRDSNEVDNLSTYTQPKRAEESGIGVVTQKKLDYLARDATPLFARVQSGELSADAAYRMARSKPKQCTHEITPDAFARAALKHLTNEQIEELIDLLEGDGC